MKNKLLKLLCGLALLTVAACQDSHSQTVPREREVRAVWITTFFQLDFPRESSRSRVVLTEQWRLLLRHLRSVGINTVFFQVRPAGDAFYDSDLAPWSRFLSGTEGVGPEEDFDPLPLFIRMAHDEGMEFHAWMNPLRATANLDTSLLAADHLLRRHPDWAFPYGNRYYLDPGRPEVRWHLLNVVEELVSKYDIDGIHMDDYFYPYPSNGQQIPDSTTFALYGEAFFSKEDWRRSNVNKLIQEISGVIKQQKKYVKFGISPFGVWRNQDKDKKGSATRNKITSYDDLYADIIKWVEEGWIDYVVPQLYWEIGHPVSDYQTLLKWWSERVDGRRLIIGHGLHKVGSDAGPSWEGAAEIPRQLLLSYDYPEVQGHAFFRARSLLGNPHGVADSLRRYFARPALLPEFAARAPIRGVKADLKKPRRTHEGPRLCWRVNYAEGDAHYFALFRFEGEKVSWSGKKRNLLFITPFGKKERKYCFVDRRAQEEKTYTYVVVSFDRFHRKIGISKSWTVEE